MYKRLLGLFGIFNAACDPQAVRPVICQDITGSSWQSRNEGGKSLAVESIAWEGGDKEIGKALVLGNSTIEFTGWHADVTFSERSIGPTKHHTFKANGTCKENLDGSVSLKFKPISNFTSFIQMDVMPYNPRRAETYGKDGYEHPHDIGVFFGDLLRTAESPKIGVQSEEEPSQSSCSSPTPI